jgi:hypothetical protein
MYVVVVAVQAWWYKYWSSDAISLGFSPFHPANHLLAEHRPTVSAGICSRECSMQSLCQLPLRGLIMEGSKAAKTVAKPIRLPPPRQRSLHSHLTGATESPVLSLPRLPVPKLEDTLTKYLASLEPFLLEDAENGGPPLDTARRKHRELADKFMKGVGSRCQRELQGERTPILTCMLHQLSYRLVVRLRLSISK